MPLKSITAPNTIFDRRQIRRARNRAAHLGSHDGHDYHNGHDFLYEWTMKQITDRRGIIKRDFPLALQIGTRPQAGTKARILPGTGQTIYLDNAINRLHGNNPALLAEEDFLPFADNSFDLVYSPLALHSVNDLPGALVQINRVLKPDGAFIGALPGGATLRELREIMMAAEIATKNGASPRIAPFADKEQMASLLQRAGFALPVVDSERLAVSYGHVLNLMHDLRMMGENNALSDRPRANPGKAFFAETARLYQKRFPDPADTSRIIAHFEIIFLIGWAPHTSQQKPLRPGSADRSLAEALGSEEHGTGDKPAP